MCSDTREYRANGPTALSGFASVPEVSASGAGSPARKLFLRCPRPIWPTWTAFAKRAEVSC